MQSIQRIFLILAVMLALLCALGALSSGLGARMGWWDFRLGFKILKWSVYTVGISTGLAVLAAVFALVARIGVKDFRYFLVLGIGLIVFGIPYLTAKEFKRLPTVADAATNIDDPPVFVELVPVREKTAANPLAYRRNDAAELQQQYFPDLTTLTLNKSQRTVIDDAVAVAKDMGLHVAAYDYEDGRLEATDTTFWFGFKDDLVVRVRQQANDRSQVDIRSASRVGYLDGGVNAKRVQRFAELLSKK